MIRYTVSAPPTPGAAAEIVARCVWLREARRAAQSYNHRRDLTYQDVRIDDRSGQLVEYAGPSR